MSDQSSDYKAAVSYYQDKTPIPVNSDMQDFINKEAIPSVEAIEGGKRVEFSEFVPTNLLEFVEGFAGTHCVEFPNHLVVATGIPTADMQNEEIFLRRFNDIQRVATIVHYHHPENKEIIMIQHVDPPPMLGLAKFAYKKASDVVSTQAIKFTYVQYNSNNPLITMMSHLYGIKGKVKVFSGKVENIVGELKQRLGLTE